MFANQAADMHAGEAGLFANFAQRGINRFLAGLDCAGRNLDSCVGKIDVAEHQ